MVETGGLENRCTGNRTGGSNPSPSATLLLPVAPRERRALAGPAPGGDSVRIDHETVRVLTVLNIGDSDRRVSAIGVPGDRVSPRAIR